MAQKEKPITTKTVDNKIKGKKPDEVRKILSPLMQDEKYKHVKKQIIKELTKAIRADKPTVEYKLTYDAINEGLEPIYFWLLDFMQDKGPAGLGLTVQKGQESFEASVASGYFGEMGQRASLMQSKGGEYLGAINQVIKSILNLIYDLNEFKMRLKLYKELKSKDRDTMLGAKYALRGIWMDTVDTRNGLGSINSLAQQLNFATLRDAFFYCDDAQTVNRVDVNERVRKILIKKVHEYNHWLEISEKELQKRYNIEKAYLKSQKETLKLYANWAKPYLKAAKKLQMKEFNTPDIVAAFSNMQMELSLYGKKEYDGKKAHPSFAKLELKEKYFEVVEVTMNFRSVPQVYQGQGGRHYIHGGKTQINFKGFVLNKNEMQAFDENELYDSFDLVEEWVGDSLKVIDEEISQYLDDDEFSKKKEEAPTEEKKKKNLLEENILKDIYKGFEEIIKPLTEKRSKGGSKEVYKRIQNEAKANVKKRTFIIYDVYKKTHGMLSA